MAAVEGRPRGKNQRIESGLDRKIIVNVLARYSDSRCEAPTKGSRQGSSQGTPARTRNVLLCISGSRRRISDLAVAQGYSFFTTVVVLICA